jgi:hypothetical protein
MEEFLNAVTRKTVKQNSKIYPFLGKFVNPWAGEYRHIFLSEGV